MEFLSDDVLEQSGVVANCRMNRERNLTGSNGYTVELGLNPVELLGRKCNASADVSWLDLCCGTGTALIEAAQSIHDSGLAQRVKIVGVDLVGMFSAVNARLECLRLLTASLTSWEPDRQYDF